LSAGGTATCVVNKISAELTGNANIATGASDTTVSNNSRPFLPEGYDQPCPVCNGDATPNDGVKAEPASTAIRQVASAMPTGNR